MSNQFATRRKQSRKPAFRAIFDWIDSELRTGKPLEVVAPAIRNQIDLKEIDASLKAQAHKHLNQQIDFIRSTLLQAQSEEVVPVEPVQVESAPESPEAVDIPSESKETLEVPKLAPLQAVEPVASEPAFNIEMLSYFVEIDPVLGLWAVRANKSILYAQWAIFREICTRNGTNWITRDDALQVIQNAKGDGARNASQLLKQGLGFFWDYQPKTKRYYLRAEHVLAVRLAELTPYEIVKNSIPGKRRYSVDCASTKHAINANFYALYLYIRAEHHDGRIYRASRDTLGKLFNASKPTLLAWEKIAKIEVRKEYGRDADTNPENLPKNAYLRAGDNGQDFAEWQKINAYYPPEFLERACRGSSYKTHDAILQYLQTNEPDYNNGIGTEQSVSTVGLPQLGKQHFDGSGDVWVNCDRHIKRHQDPFTAHYIAIGEDNRHGVSIGYFERYNVLMGVPLLEGVKVNYDYEKTPEFKARKYHFNEAMGVIHGVL